MTEIIYFQLFSASNEEQEKKVSDSCNVAILFLHAKHTILQLFQISFSLDYW